MAKNYFNALKTLLSHGWAKILLILLVIGGGYLGYTKVFTQQAAATQYQTSKAEVGTLVVSITGSGKVATSNITDISTDLTGTVEEVYVKSGDFVNSGTKLARITLDANSQERQSEAYAAYLSAVNSEKQAVIGKASNQAALESARKSVLDAAQAVTTMENILATNGQNPTTKQAYTQNEIDSVRSSLTLARQNFAIAEQKYYATSITIQSSQASLHAAKIAYDNLSGNFITSQVSGTISNISLLAGDIISSSDMSSSSDSTSTSGTNSSSQKIATVKTGSKPVVTVNVSEIDIPKIKIGNKVTLIADAFPDKTFTGKVTDIDTTGSESSGVVTYPVTISSDIDNEQIYSNMTVTSNIITMTKPDILLVPTAAVQTSSDQPTVRILKNGRPETVNVITGESSDTQIEIVSGIKEGDEVVTGVSNATSGSTTGATQRTGTSVFGGANRFGGGGFGGTVRLQGR
jgi:multidrug efflux pump subunit AcrA (membrane-fusion protein)